MIRPEAQDTSLLPQRPEDIPVRRIGRPFHSGEDGLLADHATAVEKETEFSHPTFTLCMHPDMDGGIVVRQLAFLGKCKLVMPGMKR